MRPGNTPESSASVGDNYFMNYSLRHVIVIDENLNMEWQVTDLCGSIWLKPDGKIHDDI